MVMLNLLGRGLVSLVVASLLAVGRGVVVADDPDDRPPMTPQR
jgi:hypothetical protein